MKQLIQTTLLLLALLLPATATAYDFEVDGIFYNRTSETTVAVTYETTDYNSYSGDIVIPETVTYNDTTFTVTAIGNKAFYNCTELTNVSMPNTITSIGDTKAIGQTFRSCTALTDIVIPNNVEYITGHAFRDCTALRKVTIGKSVPDLRGKRGNNSYPVFTGCNNITSLTWNAVNCPNNGNMGTTNIEQVTIGPEVEVIPNYFVKGSPILEVIIPNSVTSIGNSAFQECWNLGCYDPLYIPNSVITIGNDAFDGCELLRDVRLGNSVTTIGSNAFNNTDLIRIEIPNSVTIIGTSAFANCRFLKDVTLGNSVTTIGGRVFDGCKRLEEIIIPNSVTTIGSFAFNDCSGLTSVGIGNAVTEVYIGAFYGCVNLSRVDISSIEAWCSIDFDKDDQSEEFSPIGLSNPLFYAKHLYLNGQEISDVLIPETITAINPYTFINCLSLNSVIIPNSVTVIGEEAFYGCANLTQASIGNSVTQIVHEAFSCCSSLTDLTIPNSVVNIGGYAFNGCEALTSLNIPNSVVNIGGYAFSGCKALTSLNIPSSVQYLEGAFVFCSGLTSITVDEGNTVYDSPEGSNAIIETATNKLIAGCQTTVIPTRVTSISPYAFLGCENLTSIFIPKTVTSIEIADYGNYYNPHNLFSNCDNLVSIIVEEGNPVYDSREGCNAIIETATNTLIVGCRSTVIPNTVTAIGNSAFYCCTTLTGIDIPISVLTIGNGAFYSCEGLTELIIPNSVDSIGEEAFALCISLKNVDLGSVTAIGEYAFGKCTSLESIEIPASVTSIGDYAFYYCTGLTSAVIPDTYIVTESYTADFWFMHCTNLTSVTIGSGIAYMGGMFWECPNITKVTCLASIPPKTDAFLHVDPRYYVYNFDAEVCEHATLYVPAESLEAYQNASFWRNFLDIRPISALSGDVDGDGRVSIADLTGLIDMLLTGTTSATDYPGADVDGDGRITIADVTSIIDILLTS